MAAAYVVTTLWYVTAALVARLCPPRSRRSLLSGRAVIVGTFHNPGWYLAHIVPLARSGLLEIVVVAHGSLPPVQGVRCDPPPRWLTLLVGRTFSKLVWTVRAGRRTNADVFIGYHIVPNATIALVVGRVLGRLACYQMTGGPIELLGGGYLATENHVLGRLRAPSPRLERLAVAVAGAFDLVVVRGQSAKHFVSDRTSARDIAVIPGSVDLARLPTEACERRYDLVFVGRLAPTKQPLQFIDVVAEVRRRLPKVRACVVGDGPLMGAVRARVAELQLADAVDISGPAEDVFPYLRTARVFVLTSRSEGLSIAMVEAMAAGAVPVVADVGDLGDVVSDGENGFLIEPGNIQLHADRVVAILSDAERWNRLSSAAARRARDYNGLDRVAGLWREHLGRLIAAQVAEDTGKAHRATHAPDQPLGPREHVER